MSDFEYIHPNEYKSCTVQNILCQQGFSLTLRRKIKKAGIVFINGTHADTNSLLHPGDKLNLFFNQQHKIVPSCLPLDICYEDAHILIVNKPSGTLVHPTVNESNDTLANSVIKYYQDQHLGAGFHPVSRLDRNTSGLVLIAKNSYIHSCIAKNLTENVKKYYIALVDGTPYPYTATINAPIGRRQGSIIEREVRADGQTAVTHYKVLFTAHNISLLKLAIPTGRTHQIRVHLAFTGHPILGDDLYGGNKYLIARQALHAYKLVISHPITHKKLCIVKHPPIDMQEIIDTMRHGH